MGQTNSMKEAFVNKQVKFTEKFSLTPETITELNDKTFSSYYVREVAGTVKDVKITDKAIRLDIESEEGNFNKDVQEVVFIQPGIFTLMPNIK
jgi:hypothetical protein